MTSLREKTSISIPVDLRELLVKLKFIAMIKRGIKINTHAMSFVNANSWIGALKRGLNHENRKVTLSFIIGTVDLTIDSINKYADSVFLRNIINCLNKAKIGIDEIITTYRNDPEIIAKLDVCRDNIDIQLHKYRHLIDGRDDIYDHDPELDLKPEVPSNHRLDLKPELSSDHRSDLNLNH